jgi:hypothetical protein
MENDKIHDLFILDGVLGLAFLFAAMPAVVASYLLVTIIPQLPSGFVAPLFLIVYAISFVSILKYLRKKI